MAFDKRIQDPRAKLDYVISGLDWLAPGDTFASIEVTEASGINIDFQDFNDTEILLWISSGEVGQNYPITVHYVTAGGRESDYTFIIQIKEK
jgi:hypothetical protein